MRFCSLVLLLTWLLSPRASWAAGDADGDGFAVPHDCDDTDPTVYPGAEELCDQLDNDCNGAVDDGGLGEGLVDYYQDADGDGFGDPHTRGAGGCAPPGTVLDDEDCDDREPTVHPGAVEICDGLDNDCDGRVDLEDESAIGELCDALDTGTAGAEPCGDGSTAECDEESSAETGGGCGCRTSTPGGASLLQSLLLLCVAGRLRRSRISGGG